MKELPSPRVAPTMHRHVVTDPPPESVPPDTRRDALPAVTVRGHGLRVTIPIALLASIVSSVSAGLLVRQPQVDVTDQLRDEARKNSEFREDTRAALAAIRQAQIEDRSRQKTDQSITERDLREFDRRLGAVERRP